MKKNILLLLLLVVPTLIFAQRRGMDEETIEMIRTKKIAFITEKVGLTSAEAEKFWPVYNQLEKERFALLDQKHEIESQFQSTTPAKSDADYRKMANDYAAIHAREGKLTEEYNTRLLSILTPEKVVKLYVAEVKFRSYLFHEMRRGQGGNSDKK